MLKEKLLDDLKNSMKEKNVIRKNVIQMVRAAILQVDKDKQIEVSDDQIVEIIAKEATSMKEMGLVMKTAKEKLGASADGKTINEVAKKLLQ